MSKCGLFDMHNCILLLPLTVTVLCFTLRLSGDVSIQMVTALVLQLIQCSVKIPEKADEMQDAASAEDGADENKPQVSSMTKMYMRCGGVVARTFFSFPYKSVFFFLRKKSSSSHLILPTIDKGEGIGKFLEK